jgi:hypothetical protein
MARIQAPHDAARFGFAPARTARFAKINAAFRMHLNARVKLAAPPPEPEPLVRSGSLTLPMAEVSSGE